MAILPTGATILGWTFAILAFAIFAIAFATFAFAFISYRRRSAGLELGRRRALSGNAACTTAVVTRSFIQGIEVSGLIPIDTSRLVDPLPIAPTLLIVLLSSQTLLLPAASAHL